MTPRQRQAYNFIVQYTTTHAGLSPSYQEIADALGLKNKSGASRLVDGLRALGYLRDTSGRKRSLEPIAKHKPGAVNDVLRQCIVECGAYMSNKLRDDVFTLIERGEGHGAG